MFAPPGFGLAYDSQDVGKANARAYRPGFLLLAYLAYRNAFVDWTLFDAASLTDNTFIPDSFISLVHNRAFYNNVSDSASSIPFPATFNPQTGAYLDGSASPAVGAMFLCLHYGTGLLSHSGFSL